MLTSFKSPRSLSAIKAFASKLRKYDSKLTQSQALEQGAIYAGFANWKHATKVMPDVMRLVRLSASWANGSNKEAGLETLAYPLPWSAAELVGTIKNTDHVSCLEDGALIAGAFSCDEKINQVHLRPFPSQGLARKVLVRTLRELMFREASGLSQRYNMYFDKRLCKWTENFTSDKWDFPGADYFTTWVHPAEDSPLVFAEFKQSESTSMSLRESQKAWCKKNGYKITPLSWGGTLQTGLSPALITSTDAGYDLLRIRSMVERLPDDFGVNPWLGESEELRYPPEWIRSVNT